MSLLTTSMTKTTNSNNEDASCGLKNSGCPDENDNEQGDSHVVATSMDDPSIMYRFNFVDGTTGLWTTTEPITTTTSSPSYFNNITCPVGGMVIFYYPMGESNVVRVDTEQDWQSCVNLHNATVLSPPSLYGPNGTTTTTTTTMTEFSHLSYYHRCIEPGTIEYLTSSLPGQCTNNQKVIVHTSDTEYAQDPITGEWILHVQSLTRILTLLGYRSSTVTTTQSSIQQQQQEVDGEIIYIMDRGYQTEELANATSELIWCGLDHCPMFALDWDPTSTQADCESIIYTLLGFLYRKRPIPQYDQSESYYIKALEIGGGVPNQCTSRSYLTQLYMNKGDFVNASSNLLTLCELCSGQQQEESGVIFQTRFEYDRLNVTEFDFDQVCDEGIRLAASAATGTTGSSSWILCLVLMMITVIFGIR